MKAVVALSTKLQDSEMLFWEKYRPLFEENGIELSNFRGYTEDELISKVKEGVYITSVTGLHSGLNAQSGDFSLEAEGYLIKDGKVTSPLKLLTAGGNIYKLFNDVLLVANNSKTMMSGVITPSILIKGLKISSL